MTEKQASVSELVQENQSYITKLEAKRYMAQVISEECEMLTRKVDRELAKIASIMKTQEKILQSIEKKNNRFLEMSESVDVTLSNVLLAIKQNQFLQAWYPQQNGKHEKYVVGKYEE